MTTMTRGPLPPGVYWARRLVVLTVLVGLALTGIGVARLTGGDPAEPDRARLAGSGATSPTDDETADATPESDAATVGKNGKGTDRGTGKQRKRERGPVLASPEGPCVDRDIAVTPTARRTVAGGPVTFTLQLRTVLSPACTWRVSPQSLTVKIRSGRDDIWYSHECPRSIPTRDVVIRNNVTTEVEVTWSAKRSDEDCTRYTEWAMPGWYFIEAAALAGEPSDLHFELTRPKPDVVTKTVRADPKQDGKNDGKNDRDNRR